MSTYTFTQVGMTCDQCGRHEEWPSFKEARGTHGWSFGKDRDEPNDTRDLCADCFEETR